MSCKFAPHCSFPFLLLIISGGFSACSFPIDHSTAVDKFLEQRKAMYVGLHEALFTAPPGVELHTGGDTLEELIDLTDDEIREIIAERDWTTGWALSSAYVIPEDMLNEIKRSNPTSNISMIVAGSFLQNLWQMNGFTPLKNSDGILEIDRNHNRPTRDPEMVQYEWFTERFTNEENTLYIAITVHLSHDTNVVIVNVFVHELFKHR